MARDVEIVGQLRLESDAGPTVEIIAYGSRIRADVAITTSIRPGLRLIRSSTSFARRLSRFLTKRTLTLIVTRDGEPFVDLGAGVRGTLGLRLLGIGHVRLHRWRRR